MEAHKGQCPKVEIEEHCFSRSSLTKVDEEMNSHNLGALEARKTVVTYEPVAPVPRISPRIYLPTLLASGGISRRDMLFNCSEVGWN